MPPHPSSELAKMTVTHRAPKKRMGLAGQTGIRLKAGCLLHRRSCNFAKGNTGADGRATLGLRVDGKLPVHQLQPLRHADKAKPMGLHCLCDVKSGSRIAHCELDLIRSDAQLHIEAARTTVLYRIVQSFL